MFKRQSGTSMLKHLLTIQTVPIVTVIASNILFVPEIALWWACPRNSHLPCGKTLPVRDLEIHQSKETYSGLWPPAKPLQNALRNNQTHKIPCIQWKRPFSYPSNKFVLPICLALLWSYSTPVTSQLWQQALKKFSFVDCGWNLCQNITGVELITGLDFCTVQLHTWWATKSFLCQALLHMSCKCCVSYL